MDAAERETTLAQLTKQFSIFLRQLVEDPTPLRTHRTMLFNLPSEILTAEDDGAPQQVSIALIIAPAQSMKAFEQELKRLQSPR